MPLAASPRTPALQQRHSLGSSCRSRTPAVPRRSSVASTAASSSSSSAASSASASPLDLETLRVAVAEMRLTPDGTWLFVLRVTSSSIRGGGWLVPRRYSELRAFWDALRAVMAAHGAACEEHCHFLAGLEADKFPKKRLLHTKQVLEARANALDGFLLRLSMRLNLCSAPAAAACRARACPVLALLDEFLRPVPPPLVKAASERSDASPTTTERPAPLAKYRSFPLLRADADNRFLTQSGRRLSFAATDRRSALRSM